MLFDFAKRRSNLHRNLRDRDEFVCRKRGAPPYHASRARRRRWTLSACTGGRARSILTSTVKVRRRSGETIRADRRLAYPGRAPPPLHRSRARAERREQNARCRGARHRSPHAEPHPLPRARQASRGSAVPAPPLGGLAIHASTCARGGHGSQGRRRRGMSAAAPETRRRGRARVGGEEAGGLRSATESRRSPVRTTRPALPTPAPARGTPPAPPHPSSPAPAAAPRRAPRPRRWRPPPPPR